TGTDREWISAVGYNKRIGHQNQFAINAIFITGGITNVSVECEPTSTVEQDLTAVGKTVFEVKCHPPYIQVSSDGHRCIRSDYYVSTTSLAIMVVFNRTNY